MWNLQQRNIHTATERLGPFRAFKMGGSGSSSIAGGDCSGACSEVDSTTGTETFRDLVSIRFLMLRENSTRVTTASLWAGILVRICVWTRLRFPVETILSCKGNMRWGRMTWQEGRSRERQGQRGPDESDRGAISTLRNLIRMAFGSSLSHQRLLICI